MNKFFLVLYWEDAFKECTGRMAVNIGVQVKLACASAIWPAIGLFLKVRNIKSETNGPITRLVESSLTFSQMTAATTQLEL